MNNTPYSFFNIDILLTIRKLDTLPFIQMIFILIGSVLLVIGVIVFLTHLCRGKNPKPIAEGAAMANDMNSAIFGLILAFLVVSMYDSNRKVAESIASEANTLGAILSTSQVLDNAQEMEEAVKNYTNVVINEEWPLMRSGEMTAVWEIAPKLMKSLYEVIERANPQTSTQQSFYSKLPGLLINLNDAHRMRLLQADMHLPIQFWRVMVLMTLLSIWFLAYMNPWDGLASMIPIVIPGIIVALAFGLLISLHYPFLGPFSVSNEAYRTGNLNFKHEVVVRDIVIPDKEQKALPASP